MRKINKGREPRSLTFHKKQDYATYSNYKKKGELRLVLVRDQRGICCYCMAPIDPVSEKMKIEHWQCQENYPSRQLDFSNILGACKGNEGQSEEFQHCDTFKGSKDFSKNPADNFFSLDSTIQYLGDGRIKSSNEDFDNELNTILNLNAPSLITARKKSIGWILCRTFKTRKIKRG